VCKKVTTYLYSVKGEEERGGKNGGGSFKVLKWDTPLKLIYFPLQREEKKFSYIIWGHVKQTGGCHPKKVNFKRPWKKAKGTIILGYARG